MSGIPILMYHQIDEPPPSGTPLRGLVVSPGAFARQMCLLKLLGYRGLSMRDLEPYLRGEKQGKVVGLTFDDGYQNNLHHALPILQRYGHTATIYAVSDMMGGRNIWDEGLVAQKPLMNLDEWRAWRDAGMDIGSHTRTHAHLKELDADAARQEIAGSRLELEQQLGSPVRHFCYPYGQFRPEHAALARQAGYATATTTVRGRVHPGDDPYTLRRIMVACSTNLIQFAAKVLTSYEDKRQ
ncbi:MAG: polysaccharide deacetylase family protein [Hylemonella sp.]|uniref:polysaccharide deacetylase family protein n=1 Tax=Hylemonella sp. TaxID=2066020 RepID=UPI00391C46AD